MVEPIRVAYVYIWDMLVGALAWDERRDCAAFEYDRNFLKTGLDLAPITMPLSQASQGSAIFEFPNLSRQTFRGLPGMLADALPDTYGNRLIDIWLAQHGRTPQSFTPIERLCYSGKRGMGALEFMPAIKDNLNKSVSVDISELVGLAAAVVDIHENFSADFQNDRTDELLKIIRVGTSAGGARPKAVIALNDKTHRVRSGQVEAPEGFGYWLLKFDGIKDHALGDTAGFGRIEYAYYLMAISCGIHMSESRLLEERGRAHFMSRRFDRPGGKEKIHLQSLCAIAHFDYNEPGAYSYEQAFQVMREMRLPYEDAEQLYRRMVFNCLARNQDDHTKNIAFLMNQSGQWRLSPAFDVIYACNPEGLWTNRHQMSVNGKREGFTKEDFAQVAKEMNIKRWNRIYDEISGAIAQWPRFAKEAGVPDPTITGIGKTHIFDPAPGESRRSRSG